jgi:hypothetical protein
MTDAERDEQLERLIGTHASQRAARLDELDYPGGWTLREKGAYAGFTEQIDTAIRSLTQDRIDYRSARSTVYALRAEGGNLDVWERFLIPARKTLCDRLLAMPPRPRDRAEREQQQRIEVSIYSTDNGLPSLPGSPVYSLKDSPLGDLMEAAGLTDPSPQYMQFSGLKWGGSLKDIRRERTRITKELDTALEELDRMRRHIDAYLVAPAVEQTDPVAAQS